MQHKPLFITGIGTGIGKTLVSAVLVEYLQADYWKPIQSGDLHTSDTMAVCALVSNAASVFHPETYRLTQPYSPHKSAALDGITLHASSFTLPNTTNRLLIEGAGGLMVPINDDFLMIDLIAQLQAEVLLVSRNYLGSINHTLLSAEALQHRGIPVKGIIFNGTTDADSERYILHKTGLPLLAHIPQMETITAQTIKTLVSTLHLNL